MPKPKIIAHCLVKNEERFIWYALKSVLPFVDKIMVWDTGSTDNTVKVIKSIKSKKISFKQLDPVTPQTFTKVRQQMIEETPKDFTWIMVLDGDEVWPQNSIKKVTQFAKDNPQAESIVVRTNNLVGDIYHRLPESAGNYQLAGRKGHLALRLMNIKTIPGLHYDLPHGQQGLFDKNKKLIQERDPDKIKFLDVYYHHSTHLQRSSSRSSDQQVIKRSQKLKHQLGQKIPTNQIPEVFFAPHPKVTPSVTQKASPSFWLKSMIVTPLKILKQWLLPSKSGY